MAKLYFKRKKTIAGSAVKANVMLNGQQVLSLKSGEEGMVECDEKFFFVFCTATFNANSNALEVENDGSEEYHFFIRWGRKGPVILLTRESE